MFSLSDFVESQNSYDGPSDVYRMLLSHFPVDIERNPRRFFRSGTNREMRSSKIDY